MNWDLVTVALLGGAVGASELISRYKDHPTSAIRTWPALFYITINVAASCFALMLINTMGWFGPSNLTKVLMAGISAMAFFRTSLFVVRTGDRDVGIGPSGFLQIFLAAADRAVDRQRASVRSNAVAKLMKGIDFNRAIKALPPYCLALMQNVSPEDQQTLKRVFTALEAQNADPDVKTLLLGIELINVVGVDVLTTAVGSIQDQIRSV